MATKKVKPLSKSAIENQVGSYEERDPEAELKAAREKGEEGRAKIADESESSDVEDAGDAPE